jgi:AcrR family transcriptional regulator
VSGQGRSEQVRAVALEALYDRGYDAMSLREIARAVGIQAPSLYNYFSSKQDLLFGLMQSVMESLNERVRAAITGCQDSYAGRLRAALRAFVLFNAEHPHEAAVSDAGFKALSTENRASIVRLRDEFEALFTDLLERGREAGEFSIADVPVVRNSMLASCARIYFWYRADGRYEPAELADLVSDYLVEGVLRGQQAEEGNREDRNDGSRR